MKAPDALDTLIPRGPERPATVTTLPPDLLAQAARRLRVIALLYAFIFFMSDPLTAVLFPKVRADYFGNPLRWAPSVVSIAFALVVAFVASNRRIPVVLALAPAFEVLGSYGIAAAVLNDPSRYTDQPPLMWVAVWMLAFTIIIPSRPRTALIAALLSASAIPVCFAVISAAGLSPVHYPADLFFFGLILPNLLVVLLAWVGARVVYNLGAEVKRARELGSYHLEERLGSGGMGEVWRASHRLLARPAAVKLMRPEVIGDPASERASELRARFEREAQATACLRSPHTISLYDFGVADDGAFYYVMELLDGFDLDTLVRRFGPLPPARAIHLLEQVCHSLDEAHAAGLVHRDIKPANVFTCRYGREVDFVKVLDFGLVKFRQDDGGADLTMDRSARGTPAFMSPEQVLANRPLDGRSDIYATGCLAYWLVTGRQVFEGGTVMETLMRHVREEPVAPSARAGLPIPEALDRLILECLAKDPGARPATAEALAKRLRAIAPPDAWDQATARAWWEHHHPAPVPDTPTR